MTNGYRILLIDDERSVGELFKKLLSKKGFEVFFSESGREGIEAAKREKPDLILLDMMMPEMNGAQTMDALLADPGTAPIPIIFLSALEDRPEDIGIVKQFGASHFYNKARALDVESFSKQIIAVIEESKKKNPA